MKKLTKSLIAGILCMLIAITGITVFSTDIAYAADENPFTLTFKKKTVTLADDLNDSLENGIDKQNVKTLKKKWGKKPEYEGGNEYGGWGSYTWEKGKSNVRYFFQGGISGISYNINDKTGAICGIKIGTKKATVLKKLKKMVDAENIDEGKNSITVVHITDNRAGAVNISFSFKKGKLVSFIGTAYVTSDYME